MPAPFLDIQVERQRQERRHGIQAAAHPLSMSDAERLAILTEELGEVAHEVNECRLGHHLESPDSYLRAELVQVAAVAVAWIEAIDERRYGS